MNAMMRFQNHKIAMRLFVIPLCFLMAFSAMTSGTRESHAMHPALVFLGESAGQAVVGEAALYLVGKAAGAVKTWLNKDNVKPTRVGGGGSTRGGGAGRRYNWSESDYGQALANGSSFSDDFESKSGLIYVGSNGHMLCYLLPYSGLNPFSNTPNAIFEVSNTDHLHANITVYDSYDLNNNLICPSYSYIAPYDGFYSTKASGYSCSVSYFLSVSGDTSYTKGNYNNLSSYPVSLLDYINSCFNTTLTVYDTISSGSSVSKNDSYSIKLPILSKGSYQLDFYQLLFILPSSLSNEFVPGDRISQVTNTVSNTVNNISTDGISYILTDNASVQDSTAFYQIPDVNEEEKTLTLPDGTSVAYESYTYDYSTLTYNIYTTDITYNITYNDESVEINDGSTTNTYYYAAFDPDAEDGGSGSGHVDEDGNIVLDDPTGGSGSDPGSDSDSSGSIWDRIASGLAKLVSAVVNVFAALFDALISLFTGIVDGLTGCLDLFGEFGEFIAGFYTWLPSEFRTVISSGFTIFMLLAVIKLFRSG